MMKFIQLLLHPAQIPFIQFMLRTLKPTLRFVAMVATPLCLVNSFIATQETQDFFLHWFNRFVFSYLVTYPQAVLYVSLIKWFDSRKQP